VAKIDALKEQIAMPRTISTTFAGTAKTFEDFAGQPGALIGGAILTIYIVLALLYESFIHPLTILTGLAFAVLAHWWRCASRHGTCRSSPSSACSC